MGYFFTFFSLLLLPGSSGYYCKQVCTPELSIEPAFVTIETNTNAVRRIGRRRNQYNYHRKFLYHVAARAPPTRTKNKKNDSDDEGSLQENSLISRFLTPKIDDKGLPLADALTALIVGPSLQVFWLALNHAPSPTWLKPLLTSAAIFPSAARGTLVAPTLIHGAGLASCWLAGALAAKAYEREAFDVSKNNGSYGEVLSRLVKAGAFAVGILIISTQIDLFLEFGGRYVQLGESEETDMRLMSAFAELINDIFFEGLTITTWRFYLASQSNK
jgi:hypothetical protein